VEAERKQIKDFLYENLYYSPSLAGRKGRRRAHRHRTIRILDEQLRQPCRTTTRKKAEQESLPRVVCDYIAGMTDHFIIEQYEKALR
jgi:dGTPase